MSSPEGAKWNSIPKLANTVLRATSQSLQCYHDSDPAPLMCRSHAAQVPLTHVPLTERSQARTPPAHMLSTESWCPISLAKSLVSDHLADVLATLARRSPSVLPVCAWPHSARDDSVWPCACLSLSNVGHSRPEPSEFSSTLANLGQHWPKFGHIRPTSAELGHTKTRSGQVRANIGRHHAARELQSSGTWTACERHLSDSTSE